MCICIKLDVTAQADPVLLTVQSSTAWALPREYQDICYEECCKCKCKLLYLSNYLFLEKVTERATHRYHLCYLNAFLNVKYYEH